MGAVQLGQGSWAIPAAPPFVGVVDRIVGLVGQHEGEVFVLTSSPGDEATADRIRGVYDDARRAEWVEFEAECGKCLAELDKEIRNEKFTLAELDEEEQNVDRLRRWQRELRSRDLFGAADEVLVNARIDECVAALERFTAFVYDAVGIE